MKSCIIRSMNYKKIHLFRAIYTLYLKCIMWLNIFHLVIFIKFQTLLSTKLRTKLLQPDWSILSGERKEWLFYKIYNDQWMFWCLTVNWVWILCIMDVLYWEIHSSECTGLRSLTMENSNTFFLQKFKFFNFLNMWNVLYSFHCCIWGMHDYFLCIHIVGKNAGIY